MKQGIFIIVFLLLFLTGSIVDAKWIPENATPEDVERLIRLEKESKERILREQYFRDKAEQKKEQTVDVMPNVGERKEADRGVSSQEQVLSTNNQGEIQQQSAQGVSGVLTKGQAISAVDKETEKSTKTKKIQKTGWSDWLIIGFFLLISIGCLILYLYSMNKSGCKVTGQRQVKPTQGSASTKDTNSKGLTLLEIMVATAVIAISVLCILRVFRYASLVQPQTGYSTKAITLCEEKLEEIRNRTYESLLTITTPIPERINMGPYGWNGTRSVNGGATRTVTITKINEVWDKDGLAPPTFEEVSVGTVTYLKAKVKVEWGNIPIRNDSGTITGGIPLKRELSVFIAKRSTSS